jgi:hypothetical protein
MYHLATSSALALHGCAYMRAHTSRFLLAFTAAAAGCGSSPKEAKPTPGSTGAPAQGEPAAAYEVQDQTGRIAEAHIWSGGVVRSAPAAETMLTLGVEVKNTGTQPLELDASLLGVEVFGANGAETPGQLRGMNPDGPGARTIAPGFTREYDISFVLAQGLAPEDVNGFRVRWGLLQPDQKRYVQYTQFVPDETRKPAAAYGYAYVPAYGWYDPFFYDAVATRVQIVNHVPVRRVVVVPGNKYR